MDDGPRPTGDSPALRALWRGRSPARTWSRAPHHRRRRTAAGLGLALVVLVGILGLAASGGGVTSVAASGREGFFERIQALAGDGGGSLQAAENTAIDRTLAYTPYVRIAGAQRRELALTFDDGPGPYTPAILSILQRGKVPATFFEVGVLERYFHASTTRMLARGDVVGDHTFYHAAMGRLLPGDQQTELLDGAQALQSHGAPFPRLFRPPYGVWNASTLALLHRYRMLMVLWTIDSSDYRLPGWRAIVRSVLAAAKPGAIILLHDGGGNRSDTVTALPKIIARLRARGYQLVTVPKLLLDDPPPRNQGISSVLGPGG